MILILLASGRGSRLGNYTLKKPKCLVDVNNKPIISYTLEIFKKFNKVFVVTGYQSKQINNYLKNFKNCNFFINKKFNTTNMVESLFIPYDKIDMDVLVLYSDIIFDIEIVEALIRRKKTILPVNSEWYDYWKKRMSKEMILNDAENIEIENGVIKTIGKKIGKNIPDTQFMGMIRISLEDYRKLNFIYKEIENSKIDFTSFLDIFIKKYGGTVKAYKSNKLWLEIDSENDIRVAEKLLRKYKKL